jgi:SAM-dependent methyltransferase
MAEFYREDLAYIHDVGFGAYALGSAPGILAILDRNRIREGLVVDLGCGSGLWAQELRRVGYHVLGIDLSEQIIAIARKRVPEAEFRVGSLFDADIPLCHAVTAVGEVLNYLLDPKGHSGEGLLALFHRVYAALVPGGVFIFDLAEPGQVLPGTVTKEFTEGEDWVVLVEKEEDTEKATLTRRIVTFRRIRGYYRRDDEVHRLRLHKSTEVAKQLREVGFRVRIMRSYGRYRLPGAHAAFVARKPA